MRNICESFEETIWEHARTGAKLPAEAQAHIDRCEDCRQTLVEAKRIMGAVLEADCVPYAPDCRQAVMARIAPRAKMPRLAWAYAGAGVAFAAISAIAIVNVYTASPVAPVAKISAPQTAASPAIGKPTLVVPLEAKPYRRSVDLRLATPGKPFRIPAVHKNLKPQTETPYMVAKLPDSPRAIMGEVSTAAFSYDSCTTPPAEKHTVHYSDAAETADSYAAESAPPIISFDKAERSFKDGLTCSIDAIGSLDSDIAKLESDCKSANADGLGLEANAFGVGSMALARPTGQNDKTSRRMAASPDLDSFDKAKRWFKSDLTGSIGARGSLDSDFAKKEPDFKLAHGDALGLEANKMTDDSVKLAKPTGGSRFNTGLYIVDSITKPVALAVVHWSAPTVESADSYSYSYSDKDTETGEVTICKVKRTGDTVEIRIESKPEINQPFERGSTDDAISANT